MTAPEYIQMKAFARNDGLTLFILWLISFIFYVLGLRAALLSFVAIVLAMITPFMMGRMLRRYREDVLQGVISFRRGWAYTVFVFFYAGLLFAIAQFVYFKYMDNGFFIDAMTQMMSDPSTSKALKLLGMGDSTGQTMQALSQMRPIDLALNILTTNLMIGCVLAVLLAAMNKRSPLEKVN